MRIFRNCICICLLILSDLQLQAQDVNPHISASALRNKLSKITNAFENNFNSLTGIPLPAGELAAKAYKGKVHLVKNDEVLVQEASVPFFAASYKIRVFTDPDEALVEKAYRKWQSLLTEALSGYTSTITEKNEYRMICKSFYAEGFEPAKIEISKKIFYNDHWGVWIDISPYSTLEDKDVELSRLNDKSMTLEAIFQADDFLTHKRFYTSFGPNTQKAYNDRHYIHIPFYMEAGEKAYVVVRSKDFIPMLIAENKSTSELEQEEGNGILRDSTNDIRKVIKATNTGIYNLTITTLEPETTGEFTVDIFHDKNRRKPDYTAGSFCEKLKYLGLHAGLNFSFIEKRKKDSTGIQYHPTLSILDNSECTIFELSKFVYECETRPGKVDSVHAQFETLKAEISGCLPNSVKVYTSEELHEPGEFRILQKTDFKVAGEPQYKIPDKALSYIVSIALLSTDHAAWIKISVHEAYLF